MNVVVMKFGGTCVESANNQALSAERIMEAKDQGLSPVVVVSAMGREGQPYSTAELVKVVKGIHPKIEPRELDLLMSCGEIISTVAMAHLLHAKGYDTIALSGGQAGLITDFYYGHARIVKLSPEGILEALQSGLMVFVAGFQGVTERHAITTLGEGGSDYTAVALAVLLAESGKLPLGEDLEVAPIQIYKEVDGVMSANPKNLDGTSTKPKRIPNLTYDELVSMAELGAEVLQAKAARMARRHRVSLAVRNYSNSRSPGTVVSSETDCPSGKLVTGVADLANLLVFSVATTSPRLAGQLAEHLERERISFYPITAAPGEARFAVKLEKYRDVTRIVDHIMFDHDLKANTSPDRWALVSLIGEGLRGTALKLRPEIEQVLKEAGVEVSGAIERTLSLSLLVPEPQRKQAVKALHQAFIT